ncbi:MAG: hypothetical protein H0T18_04235 [Chloroflexia bacterium]|nr:hypothetical protein [Chloroflexia bacterium]
MFNWYGIESEAEFRRREWERMVAADARAAQAVAASKTRSRSRNGRAHGSRLPRLSLSLASLRALTAPRPRFATPLTAQRTADC